MLSLGGAGEGTLNRTAWLSRAHVPPEAMAVLVSAAPAGTGDGRRTALVIDDIEGNATHGH